MAQKSRPEGPSAARRRREQLIRKEAIGQCAVCQAPALVRIVPLAGRLCVQCCDFLQEAMR
jgi:hypothetical protein